MTTGFITSDQEPALRLEVVGPDGARSFEAIIDQSRFPAVLLLTGPVYEFERRTVRALPRAVTSPTATCCKPRTPPSRGRPAPPSRP
jgi:hypothetical protein